MNKIKIKYIHFFACLFIAILCCLQIRSLDYIVVLNDEFGYWAHAASAVGYDWKELISETPYYSWGYSIWLIPIIAILPTPLLWYKAAILLNVAFLLLSYYLCYQSGSKLFPQISDKIMALISLVVIIYPSNIIYAQVAWSETLCYFLFWLETYLIIQLDEKFSLGFYFLSIIVPIYGYAVHNRNIGILLSSVIIITVILIKNKRNAGYYLLIPVLIIVGYKGIDMIKAHQINILWNNSKASSINNVGVDSATLTHYASRIINEIKLLCISIGGKYFYLLTGFAMTLPIVVIRFVKELCAKIKNKTILSDYACSKLLILLSATAMFGISALQMNHWNTRKDMIVYGRYMENALGPLLLLALAESVVYRKELKTALVISTVSVLAGIFPVFYYMDNVNAGFNSICSPFIGVFFRIINDTPTVFAILGIFFALVLTILYLSSSIRNTNIGTAIIILCFGLTYSTLACILGYYSAESRKGYDECRSALYEQVSGERDDYELYYVKNLDYDSLSTNPKYLQFMIPNRTIHIIHPNEIKEHLKQNAIIMTNPKDEASQKYLCDNGSALLECNYLLALYTVN